MNGPRVLMLAALAVLPAGCVAAAIPLAAGGLVARSQLAPAENAEQSAQARDQIASAVVADALASAARLEARDRALRVPAESSAYRPFVAHALAAAQPDEAVRQSALLADPSSLDPARADCAGLPPAVLVDLDPAGGLAALDVTPKAAPITASLAAELPALRAANVAIAWITDRPATDAGALRRHLRDTGLDLAGVDPLLVMRYPGEPKQRRRRALGEAFCILAIAGDERADFDEVFRYMRDPSLAGPLQPLIGDGWFLVADPIAANH